MKLKSALLVFGAGLLFGVCLFPLFAADEKTPDPDQPPPRTAELKALDRYVGTWITETTINAAEWTPKAKKMKGKTKYEWILGERFVQSKGRSDSGDFEDSEILTYDPDTKKYQNWYFDSMAYTGDSVGTWDEKTQTMTWIGDLGDGSKLINKVKFVSKNGQEWTLVAKASDGKMLLNMSGKLTRQK